MAYAGLPPALFTNNLTNVQLIDDISGSFNGSTQTFALTSNSAPFHAVSARSLIVVLGGIVQKPQVDYTVDGANITFTVAPVSGLTFGARNIYGLNYLDNVNDGVITPAKLSTGGPSWNTSGTVTVSGDLNVTGSFNSGTQGLFWQDNEPANFGNDNDLKIFHNGSASFIQDTGTGPLYIEGNEITIKEYGTGTTFATFNSTGVGIGTTNPIARLDVASGIYQSVRTYLPSITDTYHLYRGTPDGVGYEHTKVFSGRDSLTYNYGSYLAFYTEGKNSGTTDDTSTERLRINSIGNVGIDTPNPGAKLDVNGAIHSRTGGIYSNTFVSYNGVEASINAGTSQFYVLVNAQERLRITSTGNVGIGTGNPSEKLEVSGKFRLFDGGYPYIDIGITTSNYFRLIHDNPNDRFYIGKNNNATLVITGSNNVEPGADATQDLGSPTKRWANIYSADLQLSNEGSSNDVDGTWGQYTIQEGEDDLFLINRRNGKKYKFVLQEVN